MKRNLRDYFAIGVIGENSILIDRQTRNNFYCAKSNPTGQKPRVTVSIVLIILSTSIIRKIGTLESAIGWILLLSGYAFSYLLARRFLKPYLQATISIKEYQFKDQNAYKLFLEDSYMRANKLLLYIAIFVSITLVTAVVYYITNHFFFIFLSLLMSFCGFLLLRLEPFKRREFLRQLIKEVEIG